MSYGHAQHLAGQSAGKSAGEPASADSPELPPVDPALWWREDVRPVLWARDVGAVYRVVLDETGMSQYRLAKLVGQSQSEVSEILKGRQVMSITVLERIVDRLGIPPQLMRLSAYGPDGTYCGEGPAPDPPKEVNAEMRRRLLLASAGMALMGRPIEGLGELTQLGGPSVVPLPSRVFEVHVMRVRTLTRSLREAGRAYGSDPQVSSAMAEYATSLLGVPGAASVKRALLVAVAELHLHAGWAGFDARLYERAMYHYNRALELATEAGDAYLQALALSYAGLATEEDGHPDDGLKMLQFAQVKAWEIPSDEQRMVVVGVGAREAVVACARADSATALQRLDCPDAANRELGESRELWHPTPADTSGDLDIVAACLALARGQLDVAEPFAATSVRRWDGVSRRIHTWSSITLAIIHVRAGEPDGLRLAQGAITATGRLSSVRARTELDPLAVALDARPSSDAKELARLARQVATTRA